jgi:hypothetical protein
VFIRFIAKLQFLQIVEHIKISRKCWFPQFFSKFVQFLSSMFIIWSIFYRGSYFYFWGSYSPPLPALVPSPIFIVAVVVAVAFVNGFYIVLGTAHYLLYRGGLRRNWGGGAFKFFKTWKGGLWKNTEHINTTLKKH